MREQAALLLSWQHDRTANTSHINVFVLSVQTTTQRNAGKSTNAALHATGHVLPPVQSS